MRRFLLSALVLLVLAGAFAAGIMAHKQEWAIYAWPRDMLRQRVLGEAARPAPGTRMRLATTEASGVRTDTLAAAAPVPRMEDQIRALEALGYASGTQAPTGASAGVKLADNARIGEGFLLATDGHAPEAWLMDMHGKTLHRWAMTFDDAFPGNTVPDGTDGIGSFRRVALLPDGALLAIYEGQGLIKLDAQSRLLWRYEGRAHHDLQVQADGSIYVLARVAHLMPELNPDAPILEDSVVKLGPGGEVLESISVLKAVLDSPYRSLYQNTAHKDDLFHTNGLEVLDGRLADRNPAFKAGNLLLSLHTVHSIVVIDTKLKQVVWALGGLTRLQHDPRILESGRLMVFDNQGDLGKSRVIEIDVQNDAITWEYSGQKHDFYSATCGTAQRLASGDTLITESDRGRALIVTPDGRTVWEYLTPNRAGAKRELIATLFEVRWLPPELDRSWVSPPAQP